MLDKVCKCTSGKWCLDFMHHEGTLASNSLQTWHILFIINEIALMYQVFICFPNKKMHLIRLLSNRHKMTHDITVLRFLIISIHMFVLFNWQNSGFGKTSNMTFLYPRNQCDVGSQLNPFTIAYCLVKTLSVFKVYLLDPWFNTGSVVCIFFSCFMCC